MSINDTWAALRRALWNVSTLLGVAMIGIIWLGTAFHLTAERQISQEAAIQHSGNLAQAFKEHLVRSFKEVDRVLLLMRENYERDPAAFDFANWAENPHVFGDVATRLGLIGTDGILKRSTAGPLAVPLNLRDREHFQAQIQAGSDELVIGKPVNNVRTGTPTIPMSRRLRAKDGSFDGVITATIDTPFFTNFYNAINVGSDGAIALIGLVDGVFRASENPGGDVHGKTVSDFLAYVSHRTTPSGWYLSDAAWGDGVRRLVSYRTVEGFPLVVMVGISDRQIFANTTFKQNSYNYIAMFSTALILLVICFNARKEHKLAHIRSALHCQNIRFDTALNNMSQGLCMFDAEKRLVVCNDRYARMYRLPPELLEPGTPHSAIIEHRVTHGLLKGESSERAAQQEVEALSALPADARSTRIDELADGRLIRVTCEPMEGGAWLATHEDITEQRNLERERDRNREFLDQIVENVPVPIFVKEASDRRYILVNHAAEKFLGVTRAEIIGKTSHDVYPAEEADLIAARDEQLLQAAQPICEERQLRTPRNGIRSILSRRLTFRDGDRKARYVVGVIEDITERKQAEIQIAHMALHDSLTGLPNRVLFGKRLDAALEQLRRGECLAVLCLDLDHFKKINDTAGQLIGDELLKAVADRLRCCVRDSDTVARLSGDEFAIIRTAVEHSTEVAALAGQIQAAVKEPYDLGGLHAVVDVSLGISLAPNDATNSAELMKRADMALYKAKTDGRGAYRFFEPDMDVRLKARRKLETDLRDAIVNGGLELFYQPIVRLHDDAIVGLEALVRWHHPERGMIAPAEFIAVAEETGLIVPLGEWVLRRACSDAADWPDHVAVAVNLSPVQFRSRNLAQTVISALKESGVAPCRLELEITEQTLLGDDRDNMGIIDELRNLGVQIVMDDFGTGYSSLNYLRRFAFDKIKIDRSFVADLLDGNDMAVGIVAAVVALARTLNVPTVAEGVESEAQLELIRAAGCTEFQGYLFSRPRPGQGRHRVACFARRACAERSLASTSVTPPSPWRRGSPCSTWLPRT
jgi:diguanylate cyclase (GGDEF)-like protein/PAS domain S-box-containing protein